MFARAAVLSCTFGAALAHSATYYVATNGGDSNPGTQALPVATLQKATDLAAAGDTVLVNNGTYTPTTTNVNGGFLVYVNKPGLTYRAINSRQAILDVQLRLYSAFYCGPLCSGLTISGFVIKNGYWSGIASNSGNGKGLTVRDNEIGPICTRVENSQTGCTGVFTDSFGSGMVEANYIHNIGRTNDAGNTFDHGVYTSGHFDITNNTLVPYNGWAIQTAAGYSGTISGNTFSGAVQFDSKPGQIMLWGSNPAISINNISTGARTIFITTFQWSSAACSVYSNSVSGVPVGAPAGCNIIPPAPPVRVTVNGTVFNTTMPVTIQVQ